MGQRLTGFDPSKLREARKATGLSQSQLAHKVGAHFTSVSDWERGVNQPSARHLASLADALAVPMEFFRAGLRRDGGTPGLDGSGVDAGREGVQLDAA